jgi:hypothetical protein
MAVKRAKSASVCEMLQSGRCAFIMLLIKEYILLPKPMTAVKTSHTGIGHFKTPKQL